MRRDSNAGPTPVRGLARWLPAIILILLPAIPLLGQEPDVRNDTPLIQPPARNDTPPIPPAAPSPADQEPAPMARGTQDAAQPPAASNADLRAVEMWAARLASSALKWYRETPATERMSWGGLLACAFLGLSVLGERTLKLRPRKIVPADFTPRFLDRLYEGKLDGGKALDYCEMNPSPAARVALAAVRRWGRPAVDLERAVALTHRTEAELLRRNVGTLRRIARLAPLLGAVGTLLAIAHGLAASSGSRGGGPSAVILAPILASALTPVITGLTTAILALVAYDSLAIRIERLSGALDRLGAETIDAIAMATQPAPPALLAASPGTRSSRPDRAHPAAGSGPTRQSQSERPRADMPSSRKASGDPVVGF